MEAFKAYILSVAEDIQIKIREGLRISTSIGISSVYNSVRNLQRAFEESIDALRYRIKLGREIILMYDSINHGHNAISFYPDYMEKELIFAIDDSDYDKAQGISNQIIDEIFKK